MRLPLPLPALLLAARLAAAPLDNLAGDANLWTLPRDEAAEKASKTIPNEFRWVSDARDTLRAAKAGSFLNLDAGETLLRFDEKTGRLTQFEISLFNRGDSGEMTEKEFNALLTRAAAALDKASGEKSTPIRHDRRSVVRADGAVWAGKTATYRLEWSKNREDGRRPEYLKLFVLPAGKAQDILKAATAGNADPSGAYKAADHLSTTPSGDKWLHDVPMVDQGQKGYCAVATTERILRLYGLPVDQHQIAQIAGSTADGGTSGGKLADALRENAGRLKVRPKILLEYDARFLESLAADYNGAARKTKVEPLPDPRRNLAAFHAAFSFDKLDAPTLLAGRAKNTAAIKRFERAVADAVDKGMPVLWSVQLGFFNETPALPQAKGGHMRLIIGYNPKEHTVIYSDSWGKGHERKTMPAAAAFAITTGMMTLVP